MTASIATTTLNPPPTTIPSSQRCEPGSVDIPAATFPTTAKDKSGDPNAIADGIITRLNTSLAKLSTTQPGTLEAIDARDSFSELFARDSFWRDHLVLSWDLRTLSGRSAIARFVSAGVGGGNALKVEVDRSTGYRAPKYMKLDEDGDVVGIEFYVTFETSVGWGRGVVRLALTVGETVGLCIAEPEREWRVWCMFVSLEGLKGFEEPLGERRRLGVEHGSRGERRTWLETREEEGEFERESPVVLIIGAGQAGLTIHARLKMLGISALIIESNAAIGDNWRKRYKQLVLHDPVWFDHMPYIPFPRTWPVFTPKDKLADFFNAYAKLLELNVWTSTTIASSSWDDAAATWTIQLNRQLSTGEIQQRTLKPRHIVMCTGHSGEPAMPSVPGTSSFKGHLLCHSSAFPGARPQSPPPAPQLKAVVIGACNSAHDICQDFVGNGYAVTMVQRSTTCVVSTDSIVRLGLGGLYDETGPDVEDADLDQWGTPAAVLKAKNVQLARAQGENDAVTLDGLKAVGFGVDRGPGEAGLLMKYLQRGGGYYIDVGGSKMLAEGKIGLRQGKGVAEIVERGVRLEGEGGEEGEVLEADEIVFATGYGNMRTRVRSVFGIEVAERVHDVWGFDEEGEIRGLWRRTGHPGFWMHGGNLALCRYYSRILALQIKAAVEGMVK